MAVAYSLALRDPTAALECAHVFLTTLSFMSL